MSSINQYSVPAATAGARATASVGETDVLEILPEMGSVDTITFEESEEEFKEKVDRNIDEQLRPNYRAEYAQRVIDAQERAEGRPFTVEEKINLFADPIIKATVKAIYDREPADTSDIKRDVEVERPDEPLGLPMGPRYASAPARPLSLEENVDIAKRMMATELESAEADVATSESKMRDAERKFEQLSEDIKTFKVNPFRLYENTLFAVTAALAAGLGAAAQSLRGGGPNTALDMVNRAIEMDVLRQKDQYRALKDSAAKQSTLYGQAIQLYGTEKKALRALKAAGAEMAAKKATLDMQKYGIEVNQQKYVNDVLAKNFRTQMSALAGVRGRGARADDEESTGKRAMTEAAKGFKRIIKGYRELYNEGGWAKTNMVAFMSKYAPNLLVSLSDDQNVKDIVADRENTKKVMNSLVRAALVAGGEGGKISDVDVELTTKEIMELMPQGTLIFPESQLNVLDRAVESWVATKTGMTADEALRKYGTGREGVRNQALELRKFIERERSKESASGPVQPMRELGPRFGL